MLHGNPKARMALYGLTLLVMALTAFRVIDGSQASRLNDIIAMAALALGIAAPSVALSNVRQHATGGTPAERYVAAAREYAQYRQSEAAALSAALQSLPAADPLSDAIRAATQQSTPPPVPPQEYAPTTYQPAQFVSTPNVLAATNGHVAFMGGCSG